MTTSVRASISKIIAVVAASVVVLYLSDYLFAYLSRDYSIPSSYLSYIHDAVGAVIAIGLAMATVSIIGHLIRTVSERTDGHRNLRGFFIIIRIIIYAIVIFWFLSYLGVNLEGALVGGAIGGVVIGFAVQSVVSNLLSGIMVSGGGFIKPGDAVSVYSWLFGQTVTGKVEDVKVLYTRLRNPVGQTFLLPNTALLGSSLYTSLGTGKELTYSFNVVLPADIPAEKLMDIAKKELENTPGYGRDFTAEIYLYSKNSGSNTYSVVLKFKDMDRLNILQDAVNRGFDRAYWSIRNAS